MKILKKPAPAARIRERPAKPPAPGRVTREVPRLDVKLLLVAFRSGEAVDSHPALEPWLENGWRVRSAVPRIVESGATKLLAVLERPVFNGEPSRAPISQRMRSLRE